VRAEASDWQRVLPSLVVHYQRLLGARAAIAANDAGGAASARTALQR